MHSDLYPYQRVAAEWLAKRKRAILADEMGVGKTPSAIAGADACGAATVLVIAPGIACENWKREFHTWQTRNRSVDIFQTERHRPTADVVIVSYDMARRLPCVSYLLHRRWDAAIVDEAQYAKNNAALVSACLYGNKFELRQGILSRAATVWLLSGGIMPNHAGELWTHVHALFPKIADGMSYQQWTETYCRINPKTGRISGNDNTKVSELARRLAPYVLRRTQKQVLPDLPPLRISQVVISPNKLPPQSTEVAETQAVVAAAYDRMIHKDVAGAKSLIRSIDEMHLASLVRWTGIAKAPAVAEYIGSELSSGLSQVVMFALHREVFDVILANVPGSVVIHGDTPKRLRQEYIDGFQGKVPGFRPVALICHMRIASTALTLTAAHNVEFVEQPWVPLDIIQAAKRCHRIGQTKPVLGRIWSLAGSVDELIGRTLVRKVRTIRSFNEALTS